ncbi:MAG TPA: hypothetical protein VN613_00780, partial [Gemmatimonadaceae bacterium]|nr:hypothetical protein [Gemmatimonadaceae bacterium]
IYNDATGAKVYDSGAVNSSIGWMSLPGTLPTLAANTDYWFCIAANASNTVIGFHVWPLPSGNAYFGSPGAPLGGLSVGIAEACHIAVTAGAFPSTMPTKAAASDTYPPIAAIVGTVS